MIVTQETKVVEVTLTMQEKDYKRLVNMCRHVRDKESWSLEYRQFASDIVDADEEKSIK